MLVNVFGLWLNPARITRVFDVRSPTSRANDEERAPAGGCRVLYGPNQYSVFPDHTAAAVAAEINRLWLESFEDPR